MGVAVLSAVASSSEKFTRSAVADAGVHRAPLIPIDPHSVRHLLYIGATLGVAAGRAHPVIAQITLHRRRSRTVGRRRPAKRSPMSRPWFFLALCVVTIALSACTSMGFHNVEARRRIDFGPPETLSLCLLVDDGITDTMARAIVDDAWREEGTIYNLRFNVVSVRPWRRPTFAMHGIWEALLREPLRGTCDRVFALIGRHTGDVVWGLLGLPEVLGAVVEDTSTHGYAMIAPAI